MKTTVAPAVTTLRIVSLINLVVSLPLDENWINEYACQVEPLILMGVGGMINVRKMKIRE